MRVTIPVLFARSDGVKVGEIEFGVLKVPYPGSTDHSMVFENCTVAKPGVITKSSPSQILNSSCVKMIDGFSTTSTLKLLLSLHPAGLVTLSVKVSSAVGVNGGGLANVELNPFKEVH